MPQPEDAQVSREHPTLLSPNSKRSYPNPLTEEDGTKSVNSPYKGYPDARTRPIGNVLISEKIDKMLLLIYARLCKHKTTRTNSSEMSLRLILVEKKYHNTPR